MRDLLHEIFSGYSIGDQELAFGGEKGRSVFFAALDALFDTDDALRDLRLRNGKLPLLSIMGVFVALRIQQDAYRKISVVLGNPVSLTDETNPDGKWIRGLANQIAHPIHNNDSVSTFFPANMNGEDGFVVAFYGNNAPHIFVNYDELLERHERSIGLVQEKILLAAEAKELTLHNIRPIEISIGGNRIIRDTHESYRAFRERIDITPRPIIDFRIPDGVLPK